MSAIAGERRIVSVLVADIAGSTSIAEQLGPERSKFLFDDVVRLMREEVDRFGGTLAQLTGDGVLALFGAPMAHENDSERAVRAALAIREAIVVYAAEVAPSYGIELAARVAVNTGPVVVPDREAPPDVLYNALGDTVNVAARLQALGELVVGPATARQVRQAFELEGLGAVELKGRREPVSAFRVVGVGEPRPRTQARLIGRGRELSALRATLDGLIAGSGAVVSITGEPGIGKSRLVAEIEDSFAGKVRFLEGHAVAYAETIPYWPVRELLRMWLGLGVSAAESRTRLELRTQLVRLLGEDADEAYPLLGTILGLALDPEQERRLGDFARDAVQQETFYWLYRLLCALAGERPHCLVLDDLQWSDEATLAALEELLPAAEQTAVCFVLIHRSDPGHRAWQLVDWASRRFRRLFVELELAPLADSEARALADADAGGELPGHVARLVAERAGGNPYFVGEAIRDLLERGALVRERDGLVLVGDVSLPGALQEALQARLDRLDTEARQLITTAAVIGRSFGLPLLERLLPRARLLPTLSELQWLQLIDQERSEPAPEFRFRHGLVQEVAYGTLIEDRRRELHLRVGEALEELYRDSPAEVYGLLGRHFAEANKPHQAADYLLRAGDAARAVYAEDEAIELYRKALIFLERTGDEARSRETLLKLAVTQHLAFDYRGAGEAFNQAFAKREPARPRLEPTERIVWATTAGWPVGELAPGHCGLSDLASWVTLNLFRGLVAIGRNFEIEPDLAERFTVSADGLSYRFVLRPDVIWSDGAPVTAHDFAFTFARLAEEETVVRSWLDGVSAEAVDERTLLVSLREPRNHFLHLLGQPALFAWPRHVYEQRGPDWYKEIPLVGNGPFVLTSRSARPDARESGQITIESAPTWHGGRGNVREVRLELQSSPEAAGDLWRRGHFDLMYEFLAALAGSPADENTVVQRAPGGITDYLGLDAWRPPLDDVRVRRAVAHAIDRHGLPQALGATPAATGGLLPPAMPGHSPRVAPAFDPDRAGALLSEAGHPHGRGLREVVLAHFGVQTEAAAAIAGQLAGVGIRVQLVPVYSNVALRAAIREQAHAHIWAAGCDFPDPAAGFLEPFLHGGTWLYSDERLERLLGQATAARDQDERLRVCREFERIWIAEHAAVVPLAYNDCLLWRRPWLTGLWSNGIARPTFAEAIVAKE